MTAPTRVDEAVLVDRALDERLARDGIVSVPLLDADTLAEVESAYWGLVPSDDDGIVLDYLRDDRRLVRELSELMQPVWERVLPGVLERHYPVYTSFVVKYPGEGSSLFLHRDLCVDDERRRRTYALWMPFTDTGPSLDNGPLAFVRGSERIHYGAFGPNAVGLFSPYDVPLNARLEPFAVRAGTALVYDARLLHASAPNYTDRPRLAVGCLLARRDQPVVQVVATGRRHRVVHEVDRDYFVDHRPRDVARGGMPSGYPVLEEYDEDPPVTAAEVLGGSLDPSTVVREVIVPDDLEEVAGRRAPLEATDGPRPHHRRDLEIRAADLPPVPTTVAGGVAAVPTDSAPVGATDLFPRRRRPDVVRAIPDLVVPLDWFRTVAASLVIVDPEGRVTLTAPEHPRRRWEVVVLECPVVRAGACAIDRVVELDLGRRVPLRAGDPVHLWNGGPGPLVVVVRAARGMRRRSA